MKKLSYFLYRFKYRFAKQLKLKVPVDISLELSSKCNLACGYCYHSDPKSLPFERGLMNKETAYRAIYEAAQLGVNSLKFNYRGESTLHPDYTRITKLAKTLASGSTFIDRLANTNFQISPTIRDDRFEGLANLTKVKISYDSFIADVFENQRHKGKHSLITENIDMFYNHPSRIKSETIMVIQAVRTLKNKDEDIEGQAKKRWPEAQISIRDMVAGRVEKDVSNFEHRKRDFSNRQSCLQAHNRMIIHHDGRVGPCCPAIKNDLIIGTFPNQSLYSIFNGLPAKKLREELLNKTAFHMNPCRTCSSFESFKGFKPSWDS